MKCSRVLKMKNGESVGEFRLRILRKIASTDRFKPVQNGVFHDANADVATDGLSLVILPASNNKIWIESMLYGEEIKGKFPNYKAVMKSWGHTRPEAKICRETMMDKLTGIIRANKFTWGKDIKVRLQFMDDCIVTDFVYLDAERLYDIVMALLADGAKLEDLVFSCNDHSSPVHIYDRQNINRQALIMPLYSDIENKHLYCVL